MKMIKNKKGSAVFIAIMISTIMLILALSYAKLTTKVDLQTNKFDEQIRLKYLAEGVTQIALLKFQRFPSVFYTAWEAAHCQANQQTRALEVFGSDAAEFQSDAFKNDLDQTSAFIFNEDVPSRNLDEIDIRLIGYNLITSDSTGKATHKWKDGVLTISARAKYKSAQNNSGDIKDKDIEATYVETVRLDRKIIK